MRAGATAAALHARVSSHLLPSRTLVVTGAKSAVNVASAGVGGGKWLSLSVAVVARPLPDRLVLIGLISVGWSRLRLVLVGLMPVCPVRLDLIPVALRLL